MLGASDAANVVVDAQPDLGQIATLLGEAEPDLVLLCVKRDDLLSFGHLGSTFEALAQVQGRPRFVWDLPGGAAFEDGYRHLVEPMLPAR